MKQDYADIIDKMTEAGFNPLWWDEVGVPRYEPFHPNMVNDIYAGQAALIQIRCQSCLAKFEVAISNGPFRGTPLTTSIKDHRVAYGDPPNSGCCATGSTMNSEALKVLQFWARDSFTWNWNRHAEYEVTISDE